MARKVKESEEAVDDAYVMPTSMTVFVQRVCVIFSL